MSAQYIDVCSRHGVELDDATIVGARLDVPPGYFESACQTLLEIGVKLGQVLWRKLYPESIKDADANLNKLIYTLLQEGAFDEAEVLAEFACNILPRHSSEQMRRIFVINCAQAKKWRGANPDCEAVIDGEDWSACGDDFKLAVAVLKGDFEGAGQIMRRIGENGGIDEFEYIDWPLFREFRESDEFSSAFEDVYGRPFEDHGKVFEQKRTEQAKEFLSYLRERKEEILSVERGNEDQDSGTPMTL